MIIPLHDDNDLLELDRRRQDMVVRAEAVESDDLRNRIMVQVCDIEKQIAELPAHTPAGIKVKVKLILAEFDDHESDCVSACFRTAMRGLDGLGARERLNS